MIETLLTTTKHSGDVPNTLMHTSASSVMLIPHNFADRDPSRESVQGVKLHLKGKESGGFRGTSDNDGEPGDLRSRMDRGNEKPTKHEAKYFGARYDKAVEVPLEALEPSLEDYYISDEHATSHLSLNGSAAGVWLEREP